MQMPKFKKAKAWLGKDLSLHIGNANKRILDGDVLEGAQYAKFVGMGFLEHVQEEKSAATPTRAASPAPAPASQDGGSMTKSIADKAAAAAGKGKGGKGKGGKESEPESKVEDPKPESGPSDAKQEGTDLSAADSNTGE